MFYLIQNGRIAGSSYNSLSCEGFETIEKDFTELELDMLNNGCLYDTIGCCVVENDDYTKYLIKLKLNRMRDIRKELVGLGFTASLPTDVRIETELAEKKLALETEWTTIQTEVDATYSSTLVNDVIASFFS